MPVIRLSRRYRDIIHHKSGYHRRWSIAIITYPGRINEGKTVCPTKRQLTRFQPTSAIHIKHTSLNALILIIAIPIERIIIIRIPIRNDIQ